MAVLLRTGVSSQAIAVPLLPGIGLGRAAGAPPACTNPLNAPTLMLIRHAEKPVAGEHGVDRSMGRMDLAGRFGGDEFCIVLRGCGQAEACQFSERLVLEASQHRVQLRSGHDLTFTISAGDATRLAGPGSAFEKKSVEQCLTGPTLRCTTQSATAEEGPWAPAALRGHGWRPCRNRSAHFECHGDHGSRSTLPDDQVKRDVRLVWRFVASTSDVEPRGLAWPRAAHPVSTPPVRAGFCRSS